jgi:DNA-directed RNA polymerase specialized sigma24 family protein
VKTFVCRGCLVPEELADQTIDRVMSKLPEIRQQFVGAPEAYFYRVAQFIYVEWRRKQHPPALPPAAAADDREAEAACLEHCLGRLAPAERELILAYYEDARGLRIERRRQLAQGLGIGLNALRLRLVRIRDGLRDCMTGCLDAERSVLPPERVDAREGGRRGRERS